MKEYDLAIIGAGPGGYTAAIYASRCGLKTCLIEQSQVGGTCLNRGCIPTKTILASLKAFSAISRSSDFGIELSEHPKPNIEKILKRKDDVINKLKKGEEFLIKAQGIDYVIGQARLETPNTLKVNDLSIKAANIIIASGSVEAELPFAKFDSKLILSSTDILNLNKIPQCLIIIGGGVIGCEFASIYSGLGSKVKIIEMMPQLLPGMDREMAKKLEIVFRKNGIEIFTETKVEDITKRDSSLTVKTSKGDIDGDMALVSVGRKPNSENLGLDKLGIKTEKSRVIVNDYLRTNLDNIYAIGDVIGGYMLAHVASHEGIWSVNNIIGKGKKSDYSAVPNCVYTHPEIASVGIYAEQAKSLGINTKSVKFPYSALGRAHAEGETDGFVKIVCETETNKILGVHIMGPDATNLIAQGTLAVKFGLKADDLASTMHAHPTLSEGVMEAAYLFLGKGINAL